MVTKYHLKLSKIIIFFTTKKKSNSLLTVWYALLPSQQPTLSLNYSRMNIGPSNGRTIFPSTHCCPTVLYYISQELNYNCCYNLFHVQRSRQSSGNWNLNENQQLFTKFTDYFTKLTYRKWSTGCIILKWTKLNGSEG